MNTAEQSTQLISRPELMKRWGVCNLTLRRRELAGLLTRCKGVKQRPVHYAMSEVLRVEAGELAMAQ